VERLHRLLLDVIKDEFERLNILEINSVQALLLFNIGENEVTAGELKSRGYYQGSNVSYNLKKLVELGYMHHQRSEIDRRSVRVRLTEKGRHVRGLVVRPVRPPRRGDGKARPDRRPAAWTRSTCR
jgi:DNA-binding MarR family transcriptional regulator